MEMKIDLVTIDKEERARGRGFMKRVKERWDQKYPEYQQASWQKLRDSAARLKKAPELMSLILVRQREEQPQEMEQPQDQEQQQQQGEEGDEEQIDFQIVNVNQAEADEEYVGNNIEDDEQIKILREILTEEDQDLEAKFINQLENLTHSSLIQIDPREKLPKVKLDNQLKESAKRILSAYLKEVDTIPEICDKVYAMGRAIGIKLGKLVEVNHGNRKKRLTNGDNRRERKLKKEIKQLRQVVAKASNKLYRRRT